MDKALARRARSCNRASGSRNAPEPARPAFLRCRRARPSDISSPDAMTKPCYGQRERHGRSPNSLEAFSILAASSALAGQTDKAHKALARLLQENPRRRLSDERFRESAIQRAEDHARLVAGLRKA